jgi:hypothetical protein
MVSITPAVTEQSTGEAVSGFGLVLSVLAVIALAVALAGWTLGNGAFAGLAGAIAVFSFVGSMACFAVDTRRYEVRG